MASYDVASYDEASTIHQSLPRLLRVHLRRAPLCLRRPRHLPQSLHLPLRAPPALPLTLQLTLQIGMLLL